MQLTAFQIVIFQFRDLTVQFSFIFFIMKLYKIEKCKEQHALNVIQIKY